MKRKVRGWRAQKCKLYVGAKSPQTLTGLQTPPNLSRYIARQWKCAQIGCDLSHGTILALMQGTYEKKGKGAESLKMQAICRCKKGPPTLTGLQITPNPSALYSGRQWKFAQIRGYLSQGTIVVLMQGAFEKKGNRMESLKMQTMHRCKKPTDLDGSAKSSESLTLDRADNGMFANWGLPIPRHNSCTNSMCI